MDIFSLLALLIIVGLAFWAVKALSGAFGIPPPIVTVIQVILVVIVVLFLLRAFGLGTNLSIGRP
jgi:hypothetical protein